jgi:hypothetical protein
MIDIDYTKKGVIILGASRSGSHMLCNGLFNQSSMANKVNLGEIYNKQVPLSDALEVIQQIKQNHKDQFIFCSLVSYWGKNALAMNQSLLDDFMIINLRRKDKVSQYISWCVFRAQLLCGIGKHSPNWDEYKNLLPWPSTENDLEMFITENHLDFAFSNHAVVYYEDVVDLKLPTTFIKNLYPIPHREIVTDYELVKTILGNYTYNGR